MNVGVGGMGVSGLNKLMHENSTLIKRLTGSKYFEYFENTKYSS